MTVCNLNTHPLYRFTLSPSGDTLSPCREYPTYGNFLL